MASLLKEINESWVGKELSSWYIFLMESTVVASSEWL